MIITCNTVSQKEEQKTTTTSRTDANKRDKTCFDQKQQQQIKMLSITTEQFVIAMMQHVCHNA